MATLQRRIKKPVTPKAKGYVLYNGPSALNGKPIVAIATMDTTNVKTGNMVQVWILSNEGLKPTEATKQGLDVSVCGGCKHRQGIGGACYVNLGQAPRAVYEGYQRGIYSHDLDSFYMAIQSRKVRLGAYGDPAALPECIVDEIAQQALGVTGYTHQWRSKRFQWALKYCQASVDSMHEVELLQRIAPKAGYFRVTSGDTMLQNEIQCLSDTHGISCLDCGKCDGKGQKIVIGVHGSLANRFVEANDIIAVA